MIERGKHAANNSTSRMCMTKLLSFIILLHLIIRILLPTQWPSMLV